MSWIDSADAVVFRVLNDLDVVVVLASLFPVEENVCVENTSLRPLRFEISATLTAINEQVIPVAEASNVCASELVNRFIDGLHAERCPDNIGVECELVALVAEEGRDISVLVVDD